MTTLTDLRKIGINLVKEEVGHYAVYQNDVKVACVEKKYWSGSGNYYEVTSVVYNMYSPNYGTLSEVKDNLVKVLGIFGGK